MLRFFFLIIPVHKESTFCWPAHIIHEISMESDHGQLQTVMQGYLWNKRLIIEFQATQIGNLPHKPIESTHDGLYVVPHHSVYDVYF